MLAQIAWGAPNVLLLDEPTNHLDLEASEALIEALTVFPGTVVVVSHDRHLVSSLATRVWEIRPGRASVLDEPFEDYVHALEENCCM